MFGSLIPSCLLYSIFYFVVFYYSVDGVYFCLSLCYLSLFVSVLHILPFRGRKVLSGGECNDPEISNDFKRRILN